MGRWCGQVERLMAHLRSSRPDDAKPLLLVLHQHRVSRGPAASAGCKNIVARWRQNGELHTTPGGSNDDWYWLHAAVAAGERGLVVSNDEMRDHVFQLLSPRFAARWKDRHRAKYTFHGNYHLGSSALYNNRKSYNSSNNQSRNAYGYGNGNGYGGYGSGGVSAQLFFPPPFSECSQKVPKTGAWLFPRAVVAASAEEEAAEKGGKRSGGGGGGEDGGGDDPDEWLCCSPVS